MIWSSHAYVVGSHYPKFIYLASEQIDEFVATTYQVNKDAHNKQANINIKVFLRSGYQVQKLNTHKRENHAEKTKATTTQKKTKQ